MLIKLLEVLKKAMDKESHQLYMEIRKFQESQETSTNVLNSMLHKNRWCSIESLETTGKSHT